MHTPCCSLLRDGHTTFSDHFVLWFRENESYNHPALIDPQSLIDSAMLVHGVAGCHSMEVRADIKSQSHTVSSGFLIWGGCHGRSIEGDRNVSMGKKNNIHALFLFRLPDGPETWSNFPVIYCLVLAGERTGGLCAEGVLACCRSTLIRRA